MSTLKEVSEKIFLIPFPCPHCKGVIGNTTNTTLYIGAAKFTRTVTFDCGYCDKAVRWGSGNEFERKNK